MKRRLTTSILLIVAFLLAMPAFGQIKKDGEINVFFGGSVHSKNDFVIGTPQASPPVNGELRFKDVLRGGIRFNVVNNGHWGQEFFYSYEGNTARLVRFITPLNIADLPVTVHNVGVTGLYYLDDDESAKVRPFLSFGIGATIYKPTSEATAIANDPTLGNLPGFGSANEFSAHYGVGFKQQVKKSLGIRVDVRHFIGRSPGFSLPRSSSSASATIFPADGAIHNLEVTGGLVFYFGR